MRSLALFLFPFLLYISATSTGIDLRPSISERELLPGPSSAYTGLNQSPFQHRWLGGGQRFPRWTWKHDLTTQFNFQHNAHTFLGAEEFKSNPEWFPLVRGKRVDLSGAKGPNPNYAHPGFAEHVAGLARSHFEANPDSLSFSLSMTDSLVFDDSDLTRELVEPIAYFRRRPDFSDLVFAFANRVAEWVFYPESRIPEPDSRFLTSYAYYWAENTPSFDLHPHVIPFLTSDRAQWWDSEYQRNDQDLIQRWGQAGPQFIGGRDYYMGEGYFIPRHYPNLAAKSINFLAKHHAQAFYAEGRPIWGWNAPLYWLAAQLLRNPYQDHNTLLRHFYSTMYGHQASPYMHHFFTRCEEIWMNQSGTWQWLRYYQHPSQAELFPPEVCQELMGILWQAYKAVGGSENTLKEEGERWRGWSSHKLYRMRIELTLKAFQFTQVASEFYFAWKACALNPLLTESDLRAFKQDLHAFHQARAKLEHLPDLESPSSGWKFKHRLLLLDPEPRLLLSRDSPDTRHQTIDTVYKADFSGELLPRDTLGLDAWTIHRKTLSSGLGVSAEPTETYEFRRLPSIGNEEAGAIQIKGSTYTSLYFWFDAEPGHTYCASVFAKGVVSPGSRTTIYLKFKNEKREDVGGETIDETPPGIHDDWLPLVTTNRAPEGATQGFAAVRVWKQFPRDFIQLDDFNISLVAHD